MSSSFIHKNRGIFVSATGIALIVALTRCTPLNSSIEKSSLMSRNNGLGNSTLGLNGSKTNTPDPAPAASPGMSQAFSLKTIVLDSDSYEDRKTRLLKKLKDKASSSNSVASATGIFSLTPQISKSRLLELDERQISELRERRATLVAPNALSPEQCTVYVAVSLPRAAFDSDDLREFELSTQVASDGKWSLSVRTSLDLEQERINEKVLQSLEGAIIAPKEALPLPSPSPSISPSVRAASEDPLS